MDEQTIQDRITKLTQEREQVKVTLAAYEGALQEAQYWLSQLSKEEVKVND